MQRAESYDWKLFSSVEHGYSKADKINMMNAPKVLDELLDKYNDYDVNANPLRAKFEFDPHCLNSPIITLMHTLFYKIQAYMHPFHIFGGITYEE